MMTHFFVCSLCGHRWTEAEAILLVQSDSTAPRPVCCGQPITQEVWEDTKPAEPLTVAEQIRNLGRAAEFIQQDTLEMQAEVYRPIREFEAKLKEGLK